MKLRGEAVASKCDILASGQDSKPWKRLARLEALTKPSTPKARLEGVGVDQVMASHIWCAGDPRSWIWASGLSSHPRIGVAEDAMLECTTPLYGNLPPLHEGRWGERSPARCTRVRSVRAMEDAPPTNQLTLIDARSRHSRLYRDEETYIFSHSR